MRKQLLLLPLLVLLLSLFGCSRPAAPEKADEEAAYHVRLFLEEEASEEDFQTALDLLEGRLNYLAGDFFCEKTISGQSIDLYFPPEALGGMDITDVLRGYLSRPLKLFFYNTDLGTGNAVPVAREDLESVTLETNLLKSVDPLDYGISEEDFSYIKLVFTEDFAREQAEAIDAFGEKLSFIQDPELSWLSLGKTIPEGDGRTFYLFNNVGTHFQEWRVYNWNQPVLPFTFSFQTWLPVNWEDPRESENAGIHQCRKEELSGDTALLIYIPSASYCPEADWDQILQTTKTRLDALDTPYAIGRQTDLPQSLAIRMPTERIGDATLPLFTSPQPLKLIAGLYDYELNVKEGTLTYDPDVRSDGGIVLDLSEVNKEAFYELTLPLAEQGGGELALTWDNIPFFSTWIDAPITDGILILDRDCHNKREAGLSLTEDWLLKLLETVYREEPLPTELALQFAGFYDEEDNIILTDCYAPSYESFLSAYQEQIAGSYPGSELSCGEDGRLKLMLNLPVDEKLPEAAANAITDICGQINFTASPFSSLTVYPIDTMAGETAEIYVIKEYVYHTLLIYGTISGGRLSQQAELWQTAIEQLPLYTQYRSDLLTWEIY